MKLLLGLGLGLAIVVGCKSPKATPGDATEPDAAADATVDMGIDGLPDAPPDVPPDVPPDAPSPSPRCLTGPTTLLDVSPLQIVSLARSGDTLYVSAWKQDTASNPTLYTFDLTTNTQSVAPITTVPVLTLFPSEGDVYGGYYATSGSIWRLHPGAAPELLVPDRRHVTYVTADSTHVYWGEDTSPTDSAVMIRRRLLAGGPVEDVMACDADSLQVLDTYVYCPNGPGILRRRKDGTGVTDGLAYPHQGYLVFAMMRLGASLYFSPFTGTAVLYRVDDTSPNLSVLGNLAGPRVVGLTATSDYVYSIDLGSGVRRLHRTAGIEEPVYIPTGMQPTGRQSVVAWNNQLYFDAADYNLGGVPYLMHCVD